MRAFIKTLFGDARNVVAVAGVLAVGGLATATGHASWAALAMPPATLLAVAWLARQ